MLAAPHFSVPSKQISVTSRSVKMPGYLRIPSPGTGKKPAILFIHGIDSSEEEVYWTENAAVERGIVTCTVDGPGQGEMHIFYGHFISSEMSSYMKSAIDFLSNHPEVDPGRIAVCGLSFGGYWAMELAITDSRIRGCVSIGGPYKIYDAFDQLPLPIRVRFSKILGVDTTILAKERMKNWHLTDRISQLNCPILVVQGAKDPLVPISQIDDMVSRIRCEKKYIVYPEGDHCCTRDAFEIRAICPK